MLTMCLMRCESSTVPQIFCTSTAAAAADLQHAQQRDRRKVLPPQHLSARAMAACAVWHLLSSSQWPPPPPPLGCGISSRAVAARSAAFPAAASSHGGMRAKAPPARSASCRGHRPRMRGDKGHAGDPAGSARTPGRTCMSCLQDSRGRGCGELASGVTIYAGIDRRSRDNEVAVSAAAARGT